MKDELTTTLSEGIASIGQVRMYIYICRYATCSLREYTFMYVGYPAAGCENRAILNLVRYLSNYYVVIMLAKAIYM